MRSFGVFSSQFQPNHCQTLQNPFSANNLQPFCHGVVCKQPDFRFSNAFCWGSNFLQKCPKISKISKTLKLTQLKHLVKFGLMYTLQTRDIPLTKRYIVEQNQRNPKNQDFCYFSYIFFWRAFRAS